MMTSDEIRQAYLSFFKGKGHTVLPSSSLIPYGDPTLLLTTAGMVQIKPYFMGTEVPPNTRITTCQKCFRTTDIDSVGDPTHLTFFEMLGNFSIGDYFKKEAIAWGWEFVTGWLKIPAEKLWVTIFLDDDEAFDYWRKIGFPEERIVRLGEKDNFWGPAGDSGPCGPCSEIHYDFGPAAGCGRPDCNPGCDCHRFTEIWNLVFTQYNQDINGARTLLPKPNIDTGMGLERTAAIMQGVATAYDTDLLIPLRQKLCALTGVDYGKNDEVDRAVRIVIEHGRGLSFLIADGVLPSNEGRGYVLRRLLRRAGFFGRKLGIEEPFLGEIADAVINKMGAVYPELIANQKLIFDVIKSEEERFINTLEAGINQVDRIVAEVIGTSKKAITGKDIFRLHDTYGFPAELTAEIAQEHDLHVDMQGFNAEMEKQREKARAAHRFGGESAANANNGNRISEKTVFTGYDCLETQSRVLHLFEQKTGIRVISAEEGGQIAVVLEKTPFYGEKGGQVGDCGQIRSSFGVVEVTDTIWSPYANLTEGTIVHLGKVISGVISTGDTVDAAVDKEQRKDTARNHTATHLLQAALREVLGTHVVQRGSLVTPERLRFDFAHVDPLKQEEIDRIVYLVNKMIRDNLDVHSIILPYRQAIDEGAIALFEEKYGDTVRVLKVGDPPVSVELCGGTHIDASGSIGTFLILSESSIGTGLRRIEALTGRAAESFINERMKLIAVITEEMKSSPAELPEKIKGLKLALAEDRKKIEIMERALSRDEVQNLLKHIENIDGIQFIAASVPSKSISSLRDMGDALRAQMKSGIIVLATIYEDKPSFIAMVTPDLVQKGFHAGKIVKEVAGVTGGGGGGKADMAQAGGKNQAKIPEALRLVRKVIGDLSSE